MIRGVHKRLVENIERCYDDECKEKITAMSAVGLSRLLDSQVVADIVQDDSLAIIQKALKQNNNH